MLKKVDRRTRASLREWGPHLCWGWGRVIWGVVFALVGGYQAAIDLGVPLWAWDGIYNLSYAEWFLISAVGFIWGSFRAFHNARVERDQRMREEQLLWLVEKKEFGDRYSQYRDTASKFMQTIGNNFVIWSDALSSNSSAERWDEALPDNGNIKSETWMMFAENIWSGAYPDGTTRQVELKEQFRAVREFFSYCQELIDAFGAVAKRLVNKRVREQQYDVLHACIYLAEAQRGDDGGWEHPEGWERLWESWN